MNNLLKGIMKYRCTVRDKMVKQFEQVRDNPKVSEKNTIFTFFSSAMFVHTLHAHSDSNCQNSVGNFVQTHKSFLFEWI